MSTTPNMDLVLATPEVTTGPAWAQLINTAFETVDLHDHSEGNGVKITPSGMEINSDLDFVSFAILNLIAATFTPQDSANASLTGSIQRVGGDLYWVNAAGASVQITNGGSIASVGSGVLTLGVPASYPYTVLVGDAQKVLLIDTSSARTVNLPAATNAMTVYLKDSVGQADINNISVTPNGTDTIDGVNAAYKINSALSVAGFISDGVAGWYVI